MCLRICAGFLRWPDQSEAGRKEGGFGGGRGINRGNSRLACDFGPFDLFPSLSGTFRRAGALAAEA